MDEQTERHREAEALVAAGRDADAQILYEALLAGDAGDARAAFQLGRILLERGDLEGIKHLRHAMTLSTWGLIALGVILAVTCSAFDKRGSAATLPPEP